MTRRTRLTLAAPLLAVLAGAGVAGCSKAKDTAAREIMCESADDLGDGVRDLAIEVRLNDLDDAREEAADMRREFNRLNNRMNRASSSERQAIEPLLQPADAAIAAFEAATTIEAMSAALDSGRGAVTALAKGVDTTLRCD